MASQQGEDWAKFDQSIRDVVGSESRGAKRSQNHSIKEAPASTTHNSSKYQHHETNNQSSQSSVHPSLYKLILVKVSSHSQLLNPNMARRKLSDEPDRMFVHETKWSEVTETICVKIKNFTEKIDDLDNKKKPIESPKFTLAGNELFVSVHPEDFRENSGEFIADLSGRKSSKKK